MFYRSAGLSVLLVVLAASVWGDELRAPTQEQVKQLKTLEESGREHDKAGRFKEAVASGEQLIALQRAVHGPDAEPVVASMRSLARLHEKREAFATASAVREELLDRLRKRHGEMHWQVVDARLERDHTDRLAQLTREQRKKLVEADVLGDKASSLHRRGKDAEAVRLGRQRLEVVRSVLGPDHQLVAECLANLALYHVNEWGIAEVCGRRAAEISRAAKGPEHPSVASCTNTLGTIAARQKDHAKALSQFTKAAETWKATHGAKSLEYARALMHIAYAIHHGDLGDQSRAEEQYREALALIEAGDDNELRAIACHNLAAYLLRQKRYDEAAPLFEKALALKEKLDNESPSDDSFWGLDTVADRRVNDELQRDELAAARKHAEQGRQWVIRYRGKEHYRVAYWRNRLAHIDRLARLSPAERREVKEAAAADSERLALHDKGQYREALKLAERIWDVRKRLLGEEDTDTMWAEAWVGLLLRNLESFDLAEARLRPGLARMAAVLPEGAPDLKTVRLVLIKLLRQRGDLRVRTGDFEAALRDRTEELAVTTAAYGVNHSQTINARVALGRVERLRAMTEEQRRQLREADASRDEGVKQYDVRRFDAAQEQFARALTLTIAAGEGESAEAATLHLWLGKTAFSLSDLAAAEEHTRQVLVRRKRHFGVAHPLTALAQRSLGFVLIDRGDLAAAESLLLDAVEIFEIQEGKESGSYGEALATLGKLYGRKGDRDREEECLQQAVEIERRQSGATSLGYAMQLEKLALVYYHRAELDRAEPLYREVLSLRRKLQGEAHPDVAVALLNVGNTIERLGRTEEAIRLWEQALAIRESSLGAKDPRTKAAAGELADKLYVRAQALSIAGDLTAARDAAAQAVGLNARALSETHWKTVRARVLQRQVESWIALPAEQRQKIISVRKAIPDSARLASEGKLPEARRLLEQALDQTRAILGDTDPLTSALANNLGHKLSDIKAYDRADSMYRLELAATLENEGKDSFSYAVALHNLARAASGRKDIAESARRYQEALDVYRRVVGPRADNVLVALDELADVHEQQAALSRTAGDWDKAALSQRRAFECKRERYGAKDWHTAGAQALVVDADRLAKLDADGHRTVAEADQVRLRGGTLYRQYKYREASEQYQKAVALYLKVLGPLSAKTLSNQLDLAHSFRMAGDRPNAERVYRAILAGYKEMLGEDHPDNAIALEYLGILHLGRAGTHEEAEHELARCLEIRRAAYGPRHYLCGHAIFQQAQLARMKGQYARAEKLGQEALEIHQATGQKTSVPNATFLLADLYLQTGDFARSEPLFRKGIEACRAAGQGVAAYFLIQQGKLYAAAGDHVRAAESYRAAHERNVAQFGVSSPFLADTILLQGDAARDKGDVNGAESLYRKALGLREKQFGPGSINSAECLAALARLRVTAGDLARAEELERQVLAIRKAAFGEEHPTSTESMVRLALVRELRGDLKGAEELLGEALALRERLFGRKHPQYAEALRHLGRLRRRQDDAAGAEAALLEALAAARANLLRSADGQSERQQLLMQQALRGYLDDLLSLTAAAKRPAGDVYGHVLAWKGGVFARQMRARELRAAKLEGSSELLDLYKSLEDTTARLAALTLSPPDPKAVATRATQVKELTDRLQTLEVDLSRRSADFRARQEREALTPEKLAAALPAGAVLVDFLEYDGSGPAPDDATHWHSDKRLLAFVIRRDRPVRLIDLGASKEVTAAVERWRLTLKRVAPAVGKDDPGAALRRLVWLPLKGALGDSKIVLLSPDGPLSRLPFAALPGDKDGSYLLEEQTLAVVPVPQMLPELLGAANESTEGAPALLVLGNVDYGAPPGKAAERAESRSAVSGSKRRQFRALEATAGEILVVRKHFEKRYRDGRAELLEEEDATEQKFRLHAPRHQWLHLATHGYYAAEAEGADAHHPGLRSGLALAGANAPLDADKDDGILTALEVAQLDLRRVQMAVLSACETALGEVVSGEGPLGLQRAFQAAGARSVVASLWSVDDNATRLLMERFYENLWKKKMTRLEALREAQLLMLREGKTRGLVRQGDEEPTVTRLPPYYWAPFVLSGDWR